MIPPVRIDGADLIAYMILTTSNIRTGKTSHIVEGNYTTNFYGLAICKYPDSEGFYLFYCDSSWNTLTDTLHETLEDAKDQAEFEYTNAARNWIIIE